MHQILFHIPNTLFGIPIFGVGILLFLIAIAMVVSMAMSFRKNGLSDDLWSYLPLSLIAIVVIVFVIPSICDEELGFPIRGYSVMLICAIVCGAALMVYRAKKLWNIPPDMILSFGITSLIFGLIGTRVFYFIQKWDNLENPSWYERFMWIINVNEGGLVVYGGIIGGTLAAIIYTRVKKMPLLATLDIGAPALALAIAIGRIGCLLNGCCYGGISDVPWAITFPAHSPAHEHQLLDGEVSICGFQFEERRTEKGGSSLVVTEVVPKSEAEKEGLRPGMILRAVNAYDKEKDETVPYSVLSREAVVMLVLKEAQRAPDGPLTFWFWDPGEKSEANPEGSPSVKMIELAPVFEVRPVHPTQVYSTINGILLCGILLVLSRFYKHDGLVTVTFFGLYALTRYILEILRTDEPPIFLGMTPSQNISVLVMIIAIIAAVIILKLPPMRGYEGMFPREKKGEMQS